MRRRASPPAGVSAEGEGAEAGVWANAGMQSAASTTSAGHTRNGTLLIGSLGYANGLPMSSK